MKDIHSLYRAIQHTMDKKDILQYTEAVTELSQNDPVNYIAQLEYVIQSDIGLSTFKSFIEKHGLCIPVYDQVMELFEKCITKCNNRKIDDSKYVECVKWLNEYKSQYNHLFNMYDYYSESIDESKYVKTYYGKNSKGIQNRKLISGMISAYGESAIPDLFITASSMGSKSVDILLEYISEKYANDNDARMLCEWVINSCKVIGCDTGSVYANIAENACSSIFNDIRHEFTILYKEAMLHDDDSIMMEYSETDIRDMYDYAMYEEYQMICDPSNNDTIDRLAVVYEMLDHALDEEVSDSVIPFLPGYKPESFTSKLQTRNKMSGAIPGYIANNHDLRYQEDDDIKPIKPDLADTPKDDDDDKKEEDRKEPTIDDYRRPSAAPLLPSASNPVDTSDNTEDKSDDKTDIKKDTDDTEKKSSDTPIHTDGLGLSANDKRAINNYYYYTYHNSLNKTNTNSNSFNKDNSSRVDRSVRKDDHSTKSDDHSRNTDDHSTHTTSRYSSNINRHGIALSDSEDTAINSKPGDKDDIEEKCESTLWNLDVPIVEAAGDSDDMKPESDHPVKDTLMDIDRKLNKHQQNTKRTMQNVQNAGRAAAKPVKRTMAWASKVAHDWKDADENKLKEQMADPHSRNNYFHAIKTLIVGGSLLKAGVLLNPVFLLLAGTHKISNNAKSTRLRNEIIGELKTEIEVIDEKIKDADRRNDNGQKYKLMRLKNEIQKKLIRVGGNRRARKMI